MKKHSKNRNNIEEVYRRAQDHYETRPGADPDADAGSIANAGASPANRAAFGRIRREMEAAKEAENAGAVNTPEPARPVRLKATGICKSFADNPVLDNVSLELRQGELVSLLGVSGGGKTTLFNIISGLLVPDQGRVLLDGGDITGKPGRISYMLQKDLLLPYRTIRDNVALPLLVKGISKKEARARAVELFDDFGLAGTELKYPAQLSGGMRQRAALLRTYMFSNDITLLDEPFSALDTLTKSAMHDWYLDVIEKLSMTTLFITHDIDEAILLSDRVCLLTGKPGRVETEITISEPRPRRKDFNLTGEFLEYKRQIIERL